MIGIIGRMSGGKTYTAVEDLMQRLYSGHLVVTNIRLKCQGVTSYLQVPCVIWKRNYIYLTDEEGYNRQPLEDYENYPVGLPRGHKDYEQGKVYIYFDEISSVFDSLTHGTDSSVQKVATWARHTEKRGQVVYLIMQFANELHKRLRVHITEYVVCVNTTNMRLPVIRVRMPFFLRGFICRTVVSGTDEETILKGTEWNKINSLVFECYDTSQIVYGSGGVVRNAVTFDYTRRGLLQWNLRLKAMIAFGVIIIIMQLLFILLRWLLS